MWVTAGRRRRRPAIVHPTRTAHRQHNMERLTLYYGNSSFYSGKALLALLEKKIPFNRRAMDLPTGEQNEPWFLKLNPVGKVPVLVDSDKVIPESEDIVQYVDSLDMGTGSRLIPAEGTPERGFFDTAHALLAEKASVPIVTHGLTYHPDLSPAGLEMSEDGRLKRIERTRETMKKLKERMAEFPDLREAYQKKLEAMEAFEETIQDRARVVAALDSLQEVLDKLELQLAKTTEASPSSWLCGEAFTAVDVTFYLLLKRLIRQGLGPRFMSSDVRGHVTSFWERALLRESVKEYNAIHDTKK